MPKNVVCKKCNNLVNDWCEKVIDSPDQDMQRDCQYFCEKTNADKIREMSDEELAKYLYQMQKNILRYVATVIGYSEEFDFADEAPDLLEWLQQPVEGE